MSDSVATKPEHDRPQAGDARASRHAQALASARAMLPPLFELHAFSSAIDIGCGEGNWLSVCRDLGAGRIVGLEGQKFNRNRSVIGDLVIKGDLERPLPDLGNFDLAISLETAEHLSPGRADSFVADICRLSDTVLFGAAIPGQASITDVNEQWPSYWAERFMRHGFFAVETLRRKVWNNSDVRAWYRVNTLLYVNEKSPLFHLRRPLESLQALDIIHPTMFDGRRKKRPAPAAAAPAKPAAPVSRPAPLAEDVDHTLSPTDTRAEIFKDPDYAPAQATVQAMDMIRDAIRAQKPLSLIRLSHCESKFLNYHDMQPIEIRRTLKRQWGYTDVKGEQLESVSRGIKDAVRGADIVGLPQMTNSRVNRIDQDGGLRLWSLIRPALEREKMLRPDVLEAPLFINSDMVRAGLMDMLHGEENVSLGIVGCRDLRESLHGLGFADVTFINVPEAARTRDPNVPVKRHYPDAFHDIVAAIRADRKPRVYFVGAGVLGKIYCAEVAKAGSIALDMGSVMDLWAGVASRSGHTESVVEYWKLAVAAS